MCSPLLSQKLRIPEYGMSFHLINDCPLHSTPNGVTFKKKLMQKLISYHFRLTKDFMGKSEHSMSLWIIKYMQLLGGTKSTNLLSQGIQDLLPVLDSQLEVKQSPEKKLLIPL